MRKVHVHRVQVQFGDCDPAGIVFFPNLLALDGRVVAAVLHQLRRAGVAIRDPENPERIRSIPIPEDIKALCL